MTRSGASAPIGVPRRRRGDEHRGVGAADAGADEPGRVHVGALGEHQREADVLDLLDAAAEHGHARVVVHRPVPDLGGDPGVALVAPEGVDADLLTGAELDVHHRRARDPLLRRTRCS